jgi:hypothetical protein
VTDYGEDTPALNVLRQHIKSGFGRSRRALGRARGARARELVQSVPGNTRAAVRQLLHLRTARRADPPTDG